MTDADLYDLFREFGRLRSYEVVHKRTTFAFVEFYDSRDAKDAIDELDGTRYDGAPILVDWAKSTSHTHTNFRFALRRHFFWLVIQTIMQEST